MTGPMKEQVVFVFLYNKLFLHFFLKKRYIL